MVKRSEEGEKERWGIYSCLNPSLTLSLLHPSERSKLLLTASPLQRLLAFAATFYCYTYNAIQNPPQYITSKKVLLLGREGAAAAGGGKVVTAAAVRGETLMLLLTQETALFFVSSLPS